MVIWIPFDLLRDAEGGFLDHGCIECANTIARMANGVLDEASGAMGD